MLISKKSVQKNIFPCLLCLLLMVQWKAEARSLEEMMEAPHTVPPVQPPPTLTTQGNMASRALSRDI